MASAWENVSSVYEPDEDRWSRDLKARKRWPLRALRSRPRHPALPAASLSGTGRTALVLTVPEVSSTCGQVWLTMSLAKRLEELFDRFLARGAESAQVPWESAWP